MHESWVPQELDSAYYFKRYQLRREMICMNCFKLLVFSFQFSCFTSSCVEGARVGVSFEFVLLGPTKLMEK